MSINGQVKTKILTKINFYESITFTEPQDYTAQIDGMLKLFDTQLFNNKASLESLRKQKILKKTSGDRYWFRIALQEDFGDMPCYMIFDETLFWFGGFKLFAWSKNGKNKREPGVIVWAEYVITPGEGFTQSISNVLDNTGNTHIDMKNWYGNLDGAHLSFDKRKKPKNPKGKK